MLIVRLSINIGVLAHRYIVIRLHSRSCRFDKNFTVSLKFLYFLPQSGQPNLQRGQNLPERILMGK